MIAIWKGNLTGADCRWNLCTWLFVSPDGVRFTPSAHLYSGSDTQDVLLFDAELAKYVAFRRLHIEQTRACNACGGSPARCGPGDRASRFVGRCESTSDVLHADSFKGCDEALPAKDTTYSVAFGPDEDDSGCIDLYTNQVRVEPGRSVLCSADLF